MPTAIATETVHSSMTGLRVRTQSTFTCPSRETVIQEVFRFVERAENEPRQLYRMTDGGIFSRGEFDLLAR